MLEGNDMAAMKRLTERFSVPLEGAQANTDVVVTDLHEMISYATQYITLSVLQVLLSGQMYWFLLSCCSLYLLQMGSWSEFFQW